MVKQRWRRAAEFGGAELLRTPWVGGQDHEFLDTVAVAMITPGQQQRVALARVLARRPRLLLLNEPLSALDDTLRKQLRKELHQFLKEFAIPTVLVTHDREEASQLGQRVVELHHQ